VTAPRVSLVASTEVDDLLPALAELLAEAVNGGASLGFLPPVGAIECRRYWLSLRAELRDGNRLLFGAWVADRLAATGQLALPRWPNGRHRAEVNKLIVAAPLQGRGIGHHLLQAMHDAARRRGRSLLLLNTRRGDRAEAFYRGQGYREAGLIPGYSLGPEGEPYDNLLMYLRVGGEDQRPAPPAGSAAAR
jgi:ribosomal protein S18 acetylase RimI-like enzyme